MEEKKLEKGFEDLERRFQLLEIRVRSLEKRLDEAGIIEVGDDPESTNKPGGPAKKIIFGVLGILSGALLPVMLILRKVSKK